MCDIEQLPLASMRQVPLREPMEKSLALMPLPLADQNSLVPLGRLAVLMEVERVPPSLAEAGEVLME